MNIWFLEPPADGPRHDAVAYGRFVEEPGQAAAGVVAALGAAREANAAHLETAVAAWLVPAGLSGDLDRIDQAVTTACPVMVAVNGLGARAFAAVSARIPAGRQINLFDAREQDSLSYLQQLAWLAAQPEPFAVMARSAGKLIEATAMGAAHLIVPTASNVDLAAILRVNSARVPGAARPTSAAEVDHIIGREASLTVTRALPAGTMLADGDIAVRVTETRGLSPTLAMQIIGRVLRYGIEPGEPLSFGHLMKKGQ
jgi:hypothetical protein